MNMNCQSIILPMTATVSIVIAISILLTPASSAAQTGAANSTEGTAASTPPPSPAPASDAVTATPAPETAPAQAQPTDPAASPAGTQQAPATGTEPAPAATVQPAPAPAPATQPAQGQAPAPAPAYATNTAPAYKTYPMQPPKPSKALMITGWAVFGGGYLFTLMIGAIIKNQEDADDYDPCFDCDEIGSRLMIPLVGPWLAITETDKTGVHVLSIILGVLQLTGVSLGIAGTVTYSIKKSRYEREMAKNPYIPRIAIAPGTPKNPGGHLSLGWSF